jgi:6-phosphogluconate dehydrogenase
MLLLRRVRCSAAEDCTACVAEMPLPEMACTSMALTLCARPRPARSERLPANLTQAQRDFFGSHTYQRTDKEGWYHTVWDATFGSADSITTSSYQA